MCHEGANGNMCCRVAMPQEAVRETCAVELDLKAFKERKVMEVLPSINPLVRPQLFGSCDKRTVRVEIKRPKKADERITIFNPTTSACTGCNTSMQPLGGTGDCCPFLHPSLRDEEQIEGGELPLSGSRSTAEGGEGRFQGAGQTHES